MNMPSCSWTGNSLIINTIRGGVCVVVKKSFLAFIFFCMPVTKASAHYGRTALLITSYALANIYQEANDEKISARFKQTILTLIKAPLNKHIVARAGLIYLSILGSLLALQKKEQAQTASTPYKPSVPSLSLSSLKTPRLSRSDSPSDNLRSACSTERAHGQSSEEHSAPPYVTQRKGLAHNAKDDQLLAGHLERQELLKRISTTILGPDGEIKGNTDHKTALEDARIFDECMVAYRSLLPSNDGALST